MPSMKVIKRRISSVTSTKQVMKAMDMVAASKLQKTRARLDAARPLFTEYKRIMDSLKDSEEALVHPCVMPRKVDNSAFIVISSDRGFCGSYNVNVCEEALREINNGKREKIIAVGLKGWDYFRRRRKNLLHRFSGVSESALYQDAEQISTLLTSMYLKGEVDEVYIAYTQFVSSLSHIPRVVRLLPLGGDPQAPPSGDTMRYEPDIRSFLEHAIPMYIRVFVYGAMVESSTCEQAARMVSMNAASNNAEEIIDELTHTHNRMRQAAITQEINEIISGANMLH